MIRKLAVTGLALALVAHAPAWATEKPQSCAAIAYLSKLSMTLRQKGMPLRDAIQLADQSKDEEFRAMHREMFIEAYKQPRYSSDEMVERAVTEFENKTYLACYEKQAGG